MVAHSTRRALLGLLGAGFFVAGAEALINPARAGDPSRELSAEEWMDAWIDRPILKGVEGRLDISRFVEPVYFLLAPIFWKPNPDQAGKYQPVVVPKGFVTDLASIPRLFWSLLRPDGNYAYAAIIHDFLYWEQTRPREVADQIFLFAMRDFRVQQVAATAIFDAVRIGGGTAWEENAKLRLRGEKRILKQFPVSPTTRWSDWKKQPNVFR